MDRPIDAHQLKQNRLRTGAAIGAVMVICVVGWFGLRFLLTPRLQASRIRIATVEAGTIEETLDATGILVPRFEQVLASPIDSRVLEVLRRPGEPVTKGMPILVLDLGAVKLERDLLAQSIDLKRQARNTKLLTDEKVRIDLSGRIELKQVDLAAAQAKHQRYKQLFEHGLVSSQEVLESELQARKDGIELRQLSHSLANLEQTSHSEIAAIDLETASMNQEVAQKDRVLELATMRADRDGVLTWVVEKEGTSVSTGAELARIADLSGFRVEANLSDVYADRLAEGMAARILVNQIQQGGVLHSILPTVTNGSLKLIFDLDQPDAPGLRPNLRVEASIITRGKPRALRVRNGPFANGSGAQEVFVVRAGRAFRTRVELGIAGFDQIEVVSGLVVGDQVIISDMSDYKHLQSIPIR